MKKEKVIIFDTTLRDGQQCPGAGMSFENNIEYARLAKLLGVDILEAGFPSASKLDFDIVSKISEKFGGKGSKMKICGLCQLREQQVDITIDALKHATKYGNSILHVYLPVDPILLKASLGEKSKDKKKLIQSVYNLIKKATTKGVEIEFTPEGYSRLGINFDFTTHVIKAAIQGGATTINCPDTIGGASRYEGKKYFLENIIKHKKIIDKTFPDNKVIWSCHNHNDLGLATDNSINSVFNGPVRQIEVCVNAVGERAGNASLEQCVMIINNFGKQDNNHFYTNINLKHLKEISDYVDRHMLNRQFHFPITGDNSARHSSGGHTNAILKNPLVYQPFDPKTVGSSISFIFGPLSGSNHAKDIIIKHGYKCSESEKTIIAQFIKEFYSDRRKGITDHEVLQGYFEFRKGIKIDEYKYSKDKGGSLIELNGKFFNKSIVKQACKGKDSALAALLNAINKIYSGIKIQNYKSESIGAGIDAKSQSSIRIEDNGGNIYVGIGSDEDIEISAFKALINAVNKSYIDTNFKI